ncbi:MAG: GTP 3',8-cyclase MoaA [Bacteroidota bacterium]|nr:GTP 3',8-cyclase MoaA [Bacteroidota bacterium]MDW8137698.1 GTP 3',8-cyclase MoaA [Bacteroidota bacterium]
MNADRPVHPALVDPFGRAHTYLRISLTERCNLRCLYCMPEEGVALKPRQELLTLEEIYRLATLFVRLGVKKIRLTGGEPLVRKGVETLISWLRGIEGLQTIALTTNGLLLKERLAALHQAGLDQLNISLDTFDPVKFRLITRRSGLELVLEAIELALALGYRPKINCVVLRGINDEEVLDFVAFTRDRPVEVRFIEYMPFLGNGWSVERLVPYVELLERIQAVYELERCPEQSPHETAKRFRVPGFRGSIGFISSMTDHFCSGCNRLRITADGHLKVCLLGPHEVSLRDALRAGATEEELTALIAAAVARKQAQHAGLGDLVHVPNRPMILIGG